MISATRHLYSLKTNLLPRTAVTRTTTLTPMTTATSEPKQLRQQKRNQPRSHIAANSRTRVAALPVGFPVVINGSLRPFAASALPPEESVRPSRAARLQHRRQLHHLGPRVPRLPSVLRCDLSLLAMPSAESRASCCK